MLSRPRAATPRGLTDATGFLVDDPCCLSWRTDADFVPLTSQDRQTWLTLLARIDCEVFGLAATGLDSQTLRRLEDAGVYMSDTCGQNGLVTGGWRHHLARPKPPKRLPRDEVPPTQIKAYAHLYVDPCAYCGQPSMVIDHIVPWARGGRHEDGMNLIGACKRCNARKRTKSLLRFLLEVVPKDGRGWSAWCAARP